MSAGGRKAGGTAQQVALVRVQVVETLTHLITSYNAGNDISFSLLRSALEAISNISSESLGLDLCLICGVLREVCPAVQQRDPLVRGGGGGFEEPLLSLFVPFRTPHSPRNLCTVGFTADRGRLTAYLGSLTADRRPPQRRGGEGGCFLSVYFFSQKAPAAMSPKNFSVLTLLPCSLVPLLGTGQHSTSASYSGGGFGLWALGFGLWALGFGLWALGFGLWALGFGLWALGFGLWALGFGLWALGFGLSFPVRRGPYGPTDCLYGEARLRRTSHTCSHAAGERGTRLLVRSCRLCVVVLCRPWAKCWC